MLTTEPKPPSISLWRDIKESLAGTELDFTTGSIGRAILILSIPMVLEMMMESIFAVVDIFFVAKLGADAVAAVGLTESILTLVYTVAMGFSMATTAVISRRIGEKNHEGAATSAVQAIILSVVVSLPISIVGIFYSKQLLALMGASQAIVDEMYMYAAIMLGGNVVVMLLFVVNAVFRGAGDAAISLRALVIANLLNIVLDPLLIFGIGPFPELGIAGAAIATTIGRGIGVLYQFKVLFGSKARIQIAKKHLVLHSEILSNIFRVSLGGMGQFFISTASWIGLIRIISEFGSNALAGYTIAIRILIFSLLPSWGMSNAAATLVGQNLGAHKPERAEKSTWISAYVNMAFLGLIGMLFFFMAQTLVAIFTDDAAVIETGASCLKILSYGCVFYAFGMVAVQSFNGAGDTKTPTIINFFCFWMLEIPLAYFLALPLGIGENGVFYSIVIAESSMAVAGYILFRKGKWKNTTI